VVTEEDIRPILNVDKEHDVQISSPQALENTPLSNAASEYKGREIKIASLSEMEKQHISHVLKRTKGIVAGPHGAARVLNIKRSTLIYRMRKLGINPGEYK
jgi:transcriptional regulator with GAF, ATPase, and Fis domain